MSRSVSALLPSLACVFLLVLPLEDAEACRPRLPEAQQACSRIELLTPLDEPLPVNSFALVLQPNRGTTEADAMRVVPVSILDAEGAEIEHGNLFVFSSGRAQTIKPVTSLAPDASYTLRYEEWCATSGHPLSQPEIIERSFSTRPAVPLPDSPAMPATVAVSGPRTIVDTEVSLDADCSTREKKVRKAEVTLTPSIDPAFEPHLPVVKWEVWLEGQPVALGRGRPTPVTLREACRGQSVSRTAHLFIQLDKDERTWTLPVDARFECEDEWEGPLGGCASAPAALAPLGLVLAGMLARRRKRSNG